MQKLRVNHNFPLNFLSSAKASFHRTFNAGIAASLLVLTSLTAQAQVTPASPAPSNSSGTTTSPAATGRGAGLPAGVNIPANIQQQINQQRGNAGSLQPNANGTNTPQNVLRSDGTVDQNNPNIDTTGNGLNKNQPATLEDGYEQARLREQAEQRRKLFGYSVFNNPDANATNPFQPNVNIATPRNYNVGPGDQLNIRMYGYSEADFSQTVSPEGNIYFAEQTGIGPVSITGLTIEQAKARIIDRLARKFVGLRKSSYGAANTFIDVSLGGTIRSIRVTVTGDAIRPGTYQMSSLSTAMNAIYQAGGPSELGSFRKVQLIRNNKVLATLDLYDYLLNGTQRNDFRLQDNDNIRFTTYISHVEITGTVKRNNIFEMLPGESLDRLLFYAGGFAAQAYKERVKVTRLTDMERKVVDVTKSEFASFTMQDGDLVTVEQLLDRFENQVTIEGAVYRPGQFSLDQHKTLKQLIAGAEGLKGDAFTGRINIIRTREDLAIENLTIDLTSIMNGSKPDITLQREDQVIIPSRFDLAEPAAVSVQGEVNQPQEGIPFMINMTLNDALLRTGGLKESAAASQVEVIRRKKDVDPRSTSAQIAQTFRFNVSRDLSLNADDNKFLLEPYDQIVVRRSPNYLVQTYANVEGEVIIPGAYVIQSKDQKVSDLVTQAGGLTPQAYVEGATLVRVITLSPDEVKRKQQAITDLADDVTGRSRVQVDSVSTSQPTSIGINLRKILERPGSSEDILVQAGDVLRIPKRLETVRVQGEVLSPNTIKFRPGQTFQDYISQSGGFTSRSQRKKSYIVYANGSVDRTRKFMFFNVYPRVEPGAEVIIPQKTSAPLTAQQLLGTATTITSSVFSLITLLLAYRAIR
ncbi:SLBB domain-containing protein [Spirosoma sp. KUDC1026]|uniref:SLBB domain-containing protein n=1 Tax=Spirosoma sp. KUDC1026 TaxID=2745947 RepID=UPI00159B8938|nr:SLBB domain-containing protein [Spirosoma sp. KUDC1026]QKZ13654.1 SLBB domain-containing protein [Spirosoma sp. KUDC1026]